MFKEVGDGCGVGGGEVPLCEVREVREGMSGVIGFGGSWWFSRCQWSRGLAVWRFGGGTACNTTGGHEQSWNRVKGLVL